MNVESNPNILIVDDESANLISAAAVLDELHVSVIKASSGEEALRQLLSQDFALILLDLYMPTMGGLELAQMIRLRSTTPIIFITACRSDDFPFEEAYALCRVDHLTKPFNPVVLKSKAALFLELYTHVAGRL